MENKAFEFIKQHRLITPGDRITVALSGGADSTALLLFLNEHREKLDIALAACHLNHGLRGEESDGDERFCEELCSRLKIPLWRAYCDVAVVSAERRVSLEVAGRDMRYLLFEHITEGGGCAPVELLCAPGESGGKIATAHTATDNMETVLMRIARGSGNRGLAAIKPHRGNIIRPLLDCTRADTERYCQDMGERFVIDSSNKSDVFTRNYVRHNVAKPMRKLNPKLEEAFTRLCAAAEADEQYLSAEAGRHYAAAYDEQNGCLITEGLAGLPEALTNRIAARYITERTGQEPGSLHIHAVATLFSASGRAGLAGGYIAHSLRGRLYINMSGGRDDHASRPAEKNTGLNCEFGVKLERIPFEGDVFGHKVSACVFPACEENSKTVKTFDTFCVMDYDKISGNITLRHRSPGDKITLSCRPAKTLKKLFNELGLSDERRKNLILAADESGPIWIEGVGIANRVLPCEDSVRLLKINIGGLCGA